MEYLMSIKILILIAAILSLFILSLLIWAFKIEPNILEIKRYTIRDSRLSGLRIVYATDFHIAKHDVKRLDKIIDSIQQQKPDLILLGGDFIKGHNDLRTMPPERISAKLRKLHAPLGVFSVLGNHDWYIGGRKMKHALQAAGIVVLENDNEIIPFNEGKFTLAGVADKITCVADSHQALKNTPEPRILLTHTPDVFPDIIDSVELVLAGHTHGGQVKLPFIGALIVPLEHGRRYAEGFIEENGKKMIVSKGLGTSRISIRFNCKPEIVVIEFTK